MISWSGPRAGAQIPEKLPGLLSLSDTFPTEAGFDERRLHL